MFVTATASPFGPRSITARLRARAPIDRARIEREAIDVTPVCEPWPAAPARAYVDTDRLLAPFAWERVAATTLRPVMAPPARTLDRRI